MSDNQGDGWRAPIEWGKAKPPKFTSFGAFLKMLKDAADGPPAIPPAPDGAAMFCATDGPGVDRFGAPSTIDVGRLEGADFYMSDRVELDARPVRVPEFAIAFRRRDTAAFVEAFALPFVSHICRRGRVWWKRKAKR